MARVAHPVWAPDCGRCSHLPFRSEITSKIKDSYHSITVSGDVYVRDKIKRHLKVGYVDFEREDYHRNPFVTYAQRRGTAEGTTTHFPNDGYTVTNHATTILTSTGPRAMGDGLRQGGKVGEVRVNMNGLKSLEIFE